MNGVFKEVEPGVFAEYRTEYKYWLYHATCGDCEDTEIEAIKEHVKECKDCQDLIIEMRCENENL